VHHGFHEICSDSLIESGKWNRAEDSKLSTFKHKAYNHGEIYLYVLWRQNGEETSDQVCHLPSQESWQAGGISNMPPELNIQTNERILKLHSRGGYHINPLNAELNPNCKSQRAEFICRVFKFCAWYSKNLNISRTKRDKFEKQKAFCTEGNRHCSEYLWSAIISLTA